MTDTANRPARYANGRFGPGNSGRPVGSYNRASRRAGLAILDHFETIQDNFLNELADNPYLYICLLSRVLPRKIEVDHSSAEAAEDEAVGPDRPACANGADHR